MIRSPLSPEGHERIERVRRALAYVDGLYTDRAPDARLEPGSPKVVLFADDVRALLDDWARLDAAVAAADVKPACAHERQTFCTFCGDVGFCNDCGRVFAT